MNVNTVETATNIAECMMIYKLQHETAKDNHLQQLKECIVQGWPGKKRQDSTDPQAMLDIFKMNITTPNQPYGNREKKTPCMEINILAVY